MTKHNIKVMSIPFPSVRLPVCYHLGQMLLCNRSRGVVIDASLFTSTVGDGLPELSSEVCDALDDVVTGLGRSCVTNSLLYLLISDHLSLIVVVDFSAIEILLCRPLLTPSTRASRLCRRVGVQRVWCFRLRTSVGQANSSSQG